MLIKIVIICTILVGGTFLIYPNLLNLSKDVPIISDNLNNLENNTVNTADLTIDNTVDKAESTLKKLIQPSS